MAVGNTDARRPLFERFEPFLALRLAVNTGLSYWIKVARLQREKNARSQKKYFIAANGNV
jgi:hypothetical protein